jgi:choline dehydrogenase
MKSCAGRALSPAFSNDASIEEYIRQTALSVWHLCGTCKMGEDDNAVVNSTLQVHGIENLRIADASVLPRVTTGNTMAPSVIVGERAAGLGING